MIDDGTNGIHGTNVTNPDFVNRKIWVWFFPNCQAWYGIIPDFAIGKCAADAPACRAQMATAQAGGGAGAAV